MTLSPVDLNKKQSEAERRRYLFGNELCDGDTCAAVNYVHVQGGKGRQRVFF